MWMISYVMVYGKTYTKYTDVKIVKIWTHWENWMLTRSELYQWIETTNSQNNSGNWSFVWIQYVDYHQELTDRLDGTYKKMLRVLKNMSWWNLNSNVPYDNSAKNNNNNSQMESDLRDH